MSLCSRRFGGALSALYRRPLLSHCGAPKAKPRQSTQRYAIADYTKAIEINPRYVEAYNSRMAEHPVQPDRDSATGRAALEGRAIHIRDVLADPEYRAGGYQQAFGYRTALGVPLLRQGATMGVFFLSRDEVDPFTEKQIELVATFADQAMIASRTQGCSRRSSSARANSRKHWSSRPPPPTCSRSSATPPSISKRYWIP